MARSKKTTERKTKQKPAKAAPPRILQIQTSEERKQEIDFNYRVRQAAREDLLDRL